MNLTFAHAEYWRHKQPVPAWIQNIDRKSHVLALDIHGCINAHAGIRKPHHVLAALNLIAILKLYRRHTPGSLLPRLDEIASNPGTLIQPERRAAYAKKWAKKILQTCGGPATPIVSSSVASWYPE